jgi:hypothetical protein
LSVVAPGIAQQVLHILRGLYFIITRQGSASFSQYNFVYYTALDILGQYPRDVESFLREIMPLHPGTVPDSPLERNLDLFFLNTAEHFTLTLSPQVSNELLLPVINSYLATGSSHQLLANFEAAHSVTLAVFSSPKHSEATVKFLPIYVNSLFRAFPKHLSSRQFRLAFKTLLKITSPPSKLAVSQPMMPAILLEVLHQQAQSAGTTPLSPVGAPSDSDEAAPPLSERAIITLTVLDALSQVPLDLLDEWLPLTAGMVNDIDDDEMREYCKHHFWQILVNGELDPERSRVCHAWWSTRGGKDVVLYGRVAEVDEEALMSGALPETFDSKL